MEKHSYFAVKVSPGKEEKTLQSYLNILERREDHGIYSVIFNPKIKGFVFVEAEDFVKAKDSIRKVSNMRGVISKEIPFEEIESYIDVEAEDIIYVNERDIVEIITGPFKGYKAKVTRVSPNRDEIVVELIDIPNPIPITLTPDSLKILEEGDKHEN